MVIDGKALADSMLTDLAEKAEILNERGITPTLAVILIGDNPASLAYIRQKQKAAERIGASVIFSQNPATIRPQELQRLVDDFNADTRVHGLIIQRPVPADVGDVRDILNSVAIGKDVDGFLPDSPFEVPVAAAVWRIIEETGKHPKRFVVIGRGETAGAPIARLLAKKHCETSIVHSRTRNARDIFRQADCIISCVGKERVVTGEDIEPGTVLISVGIWRDSDGKLRGDYDESDIAEVASFYTPTPGGVGPVNVACLMQNLVKACKMA